MRLFGTMRKSLYQRIERHLSDSTTPYQSFEVEELNHHMSREQFMDRCYQPALPKLFRGAAGQWNATKNWNVDFFMKNYGDDEIFINDNVGLSEDQFEKMNFASYIQQLKAGSRKYLRFSDVVNHHEELKDDVDRDWLNRYRLPLSWGDDLKMFMGAVDTKTNLHVGFSDFFFVQVSGVKTWTLFPPNNRIFLDPRTERTFHYYSKANPQQPNDPGFPLLKYAEKYVVTLRPGDVLWVPSFTWHYVENETETIGLRCGRSSLISAFRSSSILAALIFLATKPNIISHFITTRTKGRSLPFIKSYRNKIK